MKRFSQFKRINEISTGKLVDYVAKASQDVGRRIEKNEPGAESFKKTLKRSGKIGRAMAQIKIRANEEVEQVNELGFASMLSPAPSHTHVVTFLHDKTGKSKAVKVSAGSEDDAIEKAQSHMKKKVKGHEDYAVHSVVQESMSVDEGRIETDSGTANVTDTHVHFNNSGYRAKFTHAEIHKMDNGAKVRGYRRLKRHPYADSDNSVYSNGDEEHHLPNDAKKTISEGTVGDHIKKAVNIYFKHRELEDRASYKRDKATRDKHRAGAKKASNLIDKMRAKQAAADADKPKRVEVPNNYGAAIAQDYADQEKRRGIGHVRDSVELKGNPVYEAKKANTATARQELAQRPSKPLTGADAEKKKKESDAAWERLMAHAAAQGVKLKEDFDHAALNKKYGEPREANHMEKKLGFSPSKSHTMKDGKIYHWQDPRGKPNAPKPAESKPAVSEDLNERIVPYNPNVPFHQELDKKYGAPTKHDGGPVSKSHVVKHGMVYHYQDPRGKPSPVERIQAAKKKAAEKQSVKESAEQVNELSKGTIERYKPFAVLSQVRHAADIYDREVEGGKSPDPKQHAALAKAKKNLERANARLAKEDVDQVSELKISTLTRYGTKANQSVAKLDGEAYRAVYAGDRETMNKKFAKRDNRLAGIMKARAKVQAQARKK